MPIKSTDSPSTGILITPAGLLTAAAFAVMVWLRPDVQNSGTPFGVWSSEVDGQRAWRCRLSDFPIETRMAISFDGAAQTEVASSTALPLNTWHHIGMDYDGATLRLFTDGVLEASTAIAGTIFSSSRNCGICNYDDGGGANASEVDGDEEDFRYYNRILDVAEWATIFQTKGLDGIVQGLVTRWPINEEPVGNTILTTSIKDIGPAQLAVNNVFNSPVYIAGEVKGSRRRSASV